MSPWCRATVESVVHRPGPIVTDGRRMSVLWRGVCDLTDQEPLPHTPLIGALEVLIRKGINERLHAVVALTILKHGVAVGRHDKSGEANDVVSHDVFLSVVRLEGHVRQV